LTKEEKCGILVKPSRHKMNDLNTQIKMEASALCNIVREHFNSIEATYPVPSEEAENVFKIIHRIEKLIEDDKSQSPRT
jgi:hypothetical protein